MQCARFLRPNVLVVPKYAAVVGSSKEPLARSEPWTVEQFKGADGVARLWLTFAGNGDSTSKPWVACGPNGRKALYYQAEGGNLGDKKFVGCSAPFQLQVVYDESED